MNTATLENATNGTHPKPSAPGKWTLEQIIQALSRKLPEAVLETRKQGGATLTYIPWHAANKILDKYAPGWSWEIRSITTTADRLFLIGRLSIPTVDGIVYRDATGTELLKEDKKVMVQNPDVPDRKIALTDDYGRFVTEPTELAYGDPTSNSESMAFRRAAARFGLGLYLYTKP